MANTKHELNRRTRKTEKMWGNGQIELSRPPEGNALNILTYRNKGNPPKPKKYRGKKHQNKPSSDTKTETDFQGWCTDLEG